MAVEQMIIKPEMGYCINSSAYTVAVAEGVTYNAGQIGQVFHSAGLIFNIPSFENKVVKKILLRVRLDAQLTLEGKGRLYTGPYAYSGVGSIKAVMDYVKSGIGYNGSYQEYDMTKDAAIFLNYPVRVGFTLSFYPTDVINTTTQYVKVNYYLCELVIDYETFFPKTPDTLSPDGVVRHPSTDVLCSWRFNKNTAYSDDAQQYSIISYQVNGGSWSNITLNNTRNNHTFAGGTFKDGSTVNWRVRTCSALGLSEYSNIASFSLASTPPLAPVLIYPLNVAVSAASGATLEWRYNSQADSSPSHHEYRYRVGVGGWVTVSNVKATTGKTSPITTQTQVDWQVRSFGQMGDAGPWSEVGTFWVIGTPPKPQIVGVTGKNRPLVTFSASGFLSWEMEFYNEDGELVLSTGDVAFDGNFTYKSAKLFDDGNYTVYLRIRNEYGLNSDWAARAFDVAGDHPEPPVLRVYNDGKYGLGLAVALFGEVRPDDELAVYRSDGKNWKTGAFGLVRQLYIKEVRLNDKNEAFYTDYTAASGVLYRYRVRFLRNGGEGFADSNADTGRTDFSETVLMDPDNPAGLLALKRAVMDETCKVFELECRKTLTRLAGRELPVLQTGGGFGRTFYFNFICDKAEFERLLALSLSDRVLSLRDPRFGAANGAVTGKVQAMPAGPEHVRVAFTFQETEG